MISILSWGIVFYIWKDSCDEQKRAKMLSVAFLCVVGRRERQQGVEEAAVLWCWT